MTPLADPFTTYLALDIVRVVIAPAALVLFALVLRLTILRWRRRFTDPARYAEQTHPAVMLSYAICVLVVGVRRTDGLGEPFSGYMLVGVAVLVLGYIGVLRRVRLRVPPPPWRRRAWRDDEDPPGP
jgi:uncharacterized membrane protein YjjP (DUF1212 family)